MVRETVIMQGGCGGFLSGIERTLRERGTWAQRILCAAMMALLSMAELPGEDTAAKVPVCCTKPPRTSPRLFTGADGFAAQRWREHWRGCWQLLVWYTAWLSWRARGKPDTGRMTMVNCYHAAAVTGIRFVPSL